MNQSLHVRRLVPLRWGLMVSSLAGTAAGLYFKLNDWSWLEAIFWFVLGQAVVLALCSSWNFIMVVLARGDRTVARSKLFLFLYAAFTVAAASMVVGLPIMLRQLLPLYLGIRIGFALGMTLFVLGWLGSTIGYFRFTGETVGHAALRILRFDLRHPLD